MVLILVENASAIIGWNRLKLKCARLYQDGILIFLCYADDDFCHLLITLQTLCTQIRTTQRCIRSGYKLFRTLKCFSKMLIVDRQQET